MGVSAEKLASIPEGAAPAQFLTFRISGEVYAVGILRVREILQYEVVTKVPSTPRSIRGVMNLRGSVVPVVDLAVKLGLPESPITPRTCVVILEVQCGVDQLVMGVMADSVNEVIELQAGQIEPPPAFGTQVRVDYLVGMARADKKFILLLDIDKLLSTDDLVAAARNVDGPEQAEPDPTSVAEPILQVEPADGSVEETPVGADQEPASPPASEAQEAPDGQAVRSRRRKAPVNVEDLIEAAGPRHSSS